MAGFLEHQLGNMHLVPPESLLCRQPDLFLPLSIQERASNPLMDHLVSPYPRQWPPLAQITRRKQRGLGMGVGRRRPDNALSQAGHVGARLQIPLLLPTGRQYPPVHSFT